MSQPFGKPALRQQLFGLLRIVRIALQLGIGADDVGAHRTVARIADAVENIFHDGRRVDGIIGRLAHEFIVPGLMRHVERQKEHAQTLDLVDAHARVFLQARHFMHRNVVDEIGLARLQRREARRVLGDFLENDFFDRRLAAPIVVVAGENHVAAALIADEFVGAGADRIFVELVAEFIAGDFAENETVLQAIEKNRQRLLGDENHRQVVRRLDFGYVFEVRRLQAAAFFIAHFLNRERHVLRRQRRAVMKLDALSQLERPLVALELPRLGEHADVVFFVVVELDQRLHDMLPVAVDRAGAVIVGMNRVGDAAVKNRHPIARSGEALAQKITAPPPRPTPRARSFFRKFRRLTSVFVLCHKILLECKSLLFALFCYLCRRNFGSKISRKPSPNKIDAEHRDKNRQPGKDRQPRRAIDVASALAQHRAPGRNMHRHAEAEKAQARFGDDDDRHAEGRDHRDAGDGVRHHVAKQHIPVSGRPSALAAVTKSRSLIDKHFAAHDPAVLHPAAEHQRHDQIADSLAEKCHDRDRDQQKWKGEKYFRDFADDLIGACGQNSRRRRRACSRQTRRRSRWRRRPSGKCASRR